MTRELFCPCPSVGLCVGAILMSTSVAAAPLQTMTLPSLHVDASRPSCVDAHVDRARRISFDCLNQMLKKIAATRVQVAPVFGVIDAAGSGASNQTGTFSFTGTAVRMGSNFGRSVMPQRPPMSSFSNALLPGGK